VRDILVTFLIIGALPLIVYRPYIGVLVWSWLSYMNPHRLAFGFATDFPFAQIVAITLLVSMVLSGEKRKVPVEATTVIWVLFIIWMLISTLNAFYFEVAWDQLLKVIKIQLITFVTIILITDQRKVNQLIWVIVLSICYYSVKGGLFTLLTAGVHRVYGPSGTFIEDNNTLALAVIMMLPLIAYLSMISSKKWIKYGLNIGFFFSLVSAVGSQSRGALVALLAIAGFFWLKSNSKLPALILLLSLGSTVAFFMPDSWYERMGTIENYEEDRSAQGRINAWAYSIGVATHRLTGGGFHSWKPETFSMYAPDPDNVHAAHSIFFGTLGDHGWPGLILFLLIFYVTWKNLQWIISVRDRLPEGDHAPQLALMLQVSLIAYFSGGAFLSLAYFDLPWHLVALTLILKNITSMQLDSETAESGSASNLAPSSR
jgi:probable O-glycosylation ligase (exosortase A-associated)